MNDGERHYPQMEKTRNSSESSHYKNYPKSTGGQKVAKDKSIKMSVEVSAHDSTIRKRLDENGVHERVPR